MLLLKGAGMLPSVCLILAFCGGGEPVTVNLAPAIYGDQVVEVLEGIQIANTYPASDSENTTVTLTLAGADADLVTLFSDSALTF